MPVEFGNSLKSSYQTVFGLKFFNSIFSSTLWTSFLITAIIIILLMVFIPVKTETPAVVLFRFMLYTFITVLGVLFLHNGTLRIGDEEKAGGAISEELSNRLENPIDSASPIASDEAISVEPKISKSHGDPVFGHYGV
jgi:hypothetical protein